MSTRSGIADASPRAVCAVTNRRKLLLSLVPMSVPAALCLFSVTQRALFAFSGEKPFGQVSSTQARQIAGDVCCQITGAATRVTETSQLAAFSPRGQRTVHVWDVVCDAARSQYLLRINADTGQVFGVNCLTIREQASTEDALCSVTEAEAQAKRYLSAMGIPVRELQPMYGHAGTATKNSASWSFAYRRRVPGFGDRLLTVSVNATTGTLTKACNPAGAL